MIRRSAGGCSCTSCFIASSPASGLMALSDPSAGENSHLDSLEGRYWMRLEWRALARALGASGAARTSAIADALAFRAARHQRFPGAAAAEHIVDINEGIATYAICDRVGGCAGRDPERGGRTGGGGDGHIFRPDVRVASGAGYGLLLDALSPGWHRKITGASDFGQLLSAAAGVTAAPDAVAAAARYDGAQVRAAEEQRDREQQAIIAELRRRYVDGPVLIVPRAGSGSINNMGATVIPGAGTVFRAMANKGAWGFFDAQGGALVSADGETISLPAPVVVDATTLKGDGWTATVGPGVDCAAGPTAGIVPRRAAMTKCRGYRTCPMCQLTHGSEHPNGHPLAFVGRAARSRRVRLFSDGTRIGAAPAPARQSSVTTDVV